MEEGKKKIKVFDGNTETKEETAGEEQQLEVIEGLEVNAENAAEIITTGKGVLKLFKPAELGGKVTDSVYFDLSSVTALKYRQILRSLKRPVADPTKDLDVQLNVFSAASDIPVAELMGLSMKDAAQIGMVVYYFLAS